MKFVFALALVCLYVALMRARPNMDIHKRAVGDGSGDGGAKLEAELKQKGSEVQEKEKEDEAAERAEERGEKEEAERAGKRREFSGNQATEEAKKAEREEKEPELRKEEQEEQETEEAEEGEAKEPSFDRQKRAAHDHSSAALWPTPAIPYKFHENCGNEGGDPGDKSKDDQTIASIVAAAALEWNYAAGLNITYDQTCTQPVCIEIRCPEATDPNAGCWSHMGYQEGTTDGNVIAFQNNACYHHGVVLHEMGHALGLMHEVETTEQLNGTFAEQWTV